MGQGENREQGDYASWLDSSARGGLGEAQTSPRFRTYFEQEQAALQTMQDDGLLIQGEKALRVLPWAKLLIRNICMVFDRYLREKASGQQFSRVI